MAGYNLGISDYGDGADTSATSDLAEANKLKKFDMVKSLLGGMNSGNENQQSFENSFIGQNTYNPTNINSSTNPDLQMFDAARTFSRIGGDFSPNRGPSEPPVNPQNKTFDQSQPAGNMSPPWMPLGQFPQTPQNPMGTPPGAQKGSEGASYSPNTLSAGSLINPESAGVARATSLEDMQRALMGQGWNSANLPTSFQNPSVGTGGYQQERAALKAGGEAEKNAYETYGAAKTAGSETAQKAITGQQEEFNTNAKGLMGEQAQLRKDAAQLQEKYKQLPANEIWAGISNGRKIAAYFGAFANGFSGRGGNPVSQIIDDVRTTQQQNFNNEWTSFKNRQDLTLQDLKSQMDFGDQNMKFTKGQYDMIMAGAEGQFAKAQGEVAKQNALAASGRAYQNMLGLEAQNKMNNNQLLMQYNSMVANLATNKLAVNFGPDKNGTPVILQAHTEADLPGLQQTAGIANQISTLTDLRNRVNNGLINHQEANAAFAQLVLNDPNTSPEAKAQYQKDPNLLNYFSPDRLQMLDMHMFQLQQQLQSGMQRFGQPATIKNPINQFPGTGIKTPEVQKMGARPQTAQPEPRLTPNIKIGR